MLARYDRYILGKLMVTFGFFTLIIVLIYWINRSIRLFDRLIGDGQAMGLFLQFSLLTLPYLIYVMLPLSAFAATIQVANRLGSDSEMVVLQGSGVSAFRIARPALYLGLMSATLMMLLANVLVPTSRAQIAELEAQLAENVDTRLLEEGRFINPIAGLTVFIGEITDNGVLNRVLLSDKRDSSNEVLYAADQALLVRADDGPRLVLIEGQAQTLQSDGSLSMVRFEDFALSLGQISEPSERIITELRAQPTAMLFRADPDDLERLRKTEAQFLAEAHQRIASPMLAVFTALLGFAALLVGGFSRFGFWQQFSGAVVLIVITQLIANAVEPLAVAGSGRWVLLYLPVAFAAVAVFVMLWLADHPLHLKQRFPGKQGAT